MATMYAPQNNGPHTELTGAINSADTSVAVENSAVLPSAPNVLTIGLGEDAELVLMQAKTGNILTVERGYNGTAAKEWAPGDWIYRAITAQDVVALQENVSAAQSTADAALPAANMVNNLTTTAAGLALDARQGKALNDAKAPNNHAVSTTIYGIATTSVYGHAMASSATPAMDGTASVGTNNGKFAREGHVHPRDTGVLPKSGTISEAMTGPLYGQGLYPTGTELYFIGNSSLRYHSLYLLNNPNVSSDQREKKDIAPISEALALIMGIEPVKFRRKRGDQSLHYGVLAQQVRDTVQEIGIGDSALYSRDSIDENIPSDEATEDQVCYGVFYTELIAPMIAVIQKQQRRIEALEALVIQEQQRRIEALEALVFGEK